MYNNSLMAFIDEWTKPDMTIDGFKEYLVKEINSVIGRSKCNNLARQYKYNEETDPDKTACTPILLLFNIQRIIILNKNLNNDCETQLFNKFPFYLYKEENWNVEHIASNTDNDFSKTDTQKEWLKTFLFDNTLSEKDKKDLNLTCEDDISYYVICVLNESLTDSTVNLKAPLAINVRNRTGKQIILDEPAYSFKHAIPANGRE